MVTVYNENHKRPKTETASYWLVKQAVHIIHFFFFPVPVCAITASGVPGGTLVSMNRFSTLCGWLVQRQDGEWRVNMTEWAGDID
jgi:hypothetical protein